MNVAIIGAGGMGRAWTEMLERHGLAKVVAFVDPYIDSSRSIPWLGERSSTPIVSSINELDGRSVEAVVVTALSPAHYTVVDAALRHGFHVIVEKPFTTELAEAEKLVALADAAGLVLMASQNYRFFPGPQKIRSIVNDGEFGAVRAVIGQFWCDWPGKPYQHKMTHAMALEMAIHHFDLCRAMFSAEPEKGWVREWNPSTSPFASGGALEALFEMKSKTMAFPFLYSGSLVGKAPRTPWGGVWRFEFDRATLVADTLDGQYGLFRFDGESQELLTPFAGDGMMLEASFEHFAACIRQGTEPWSSGRDNLGTLRMVLDYGVPGAGTDVRAQSPIGNGLSS